MFYELLDPSFLRIALINTFYNQFFQVFDNNQILNWRANDFVYKTLGENKSSCEKEKRLIYKGLAILVKCKYLKLEKGIDNKKVYFYSETIKLMIHKEKNSI